MLFKWGEKKEKNKNINYQADNEHNEKLMT